MSCVICTRAHRAHEQRLARTLPACRVAPLLRRGAPRKRAHPAPSLRRHDPESGRGTAGVSARAYTVCPCHVDPLPAVHPKQCVPAGRHRRRGWVARASGVARATWADSRTGAYRVAAQLVERRDVENGARGAGQLRRAARLASAAARRHVERHVEVAIVHLPVVAHLRERVAPLRARRSPPPSLPLPPSLPPCLPSPSLAHRDEGAAHEVVEEVSRKCLGSV